MKLCKCGCGESTNIITHTNKKFGYIKGEYFTYLKGHSPMSKKEKMKKRKNWVLHNPMHKLSPNAKFKWRQNLSAACIGRVGPKKGQKRPEISGDRHPNWKNGRTSLWHLIRNLPESKSWRFQIFKRDNFTCQECDYRHGKILEAHHIKSFSTLLGEFLKQFSQFSPIEDKETLARLALTYKDFWDVNNGITLCKKCHYDTQKVYK